MKNYNTMLIEEQLKHQLYHQVKFINMNILLVKICYHLTNNKLPSNQQQIIEQARFTYSPLGKAFEKQIKTIEDQGQKQVDALENLKPKEETRPIENNLIINEKLKLYLINLLKKEKKNDE